MPAVFDGKDKSQWESWSDSVFNYFEAYEHEFTTDKKKILFTSSLLRVKDNSPCPAADWLWVWKRTNTDPNTRFLLATVTWDTFFTSLRDKFEDQTIANNALVKLQTMQQGKTLLRDFLSKFNIIAGLANKTDAGNHNLLISLLWKAVNQELIMILYHDPNPVTTNYDDFCKVLEQIEDNLNLQRFNSNMAGRTTLAPMSNTTSGSYTAPANSPGIPMDIDRYWGTTMCFNCGEIPKPGKKGHISWNCVKPCRHCGERHPGQKCTKRPAKKKLFNQAAFLETDTSAMTDKDKKASWVFKGEQRWHDFGFPKYAWFFRRHHL